MISSFVRKKKTEQNLHHVWLHSITNRPKLISFVSVGRQSVRSFLDDPTLVSIFIVFVEIYCSPLARKLQARHPTKRIRCEETEKSCTPRAWSKQNERLNFEDYSSVNASQDEAVRSFFVVGVADEFIDERASGLSWRFSQEKIRFRKEKQVFEENSDVSPNGLRIRHLAGTKKPRLKLQPIPWLTT